MKKWIAVALFTLASASLATTLNPTAAHNYSTDGMTGRFLSDLFVDYTGISGIVPRTARVDFEKNLQSMWRRKISRAKGNPVIHSLAREVLADYRGKHAGRMKVADYIRHVNAVVAQGRRDLDWQRVGEIEGLDKRRLALTKKIAANLHGRDLLAYELTELMPGYDGELNKAVLTFLVQNAGRRYIESIPAMHDPYCSFGPYQFTQFAWYKGPDGLRGGSRVNEASRKPVRHGSVVKLRDDEHYIAALYFAIDNLSHTIRGLNSKELATLERVAGKRHDEIVEFVAIAHHAPYGVHGAQGAMKRWLDHGAQTSFRRSCSRSLVIYVKKTQANLRALRGA